MVVKGYGAGVGGGGTRGESLFLCLSVCVCKIVEFLNDSIALKLMQCV